jgi:hypothetical protein
MSEKIFYYFNADKTLGYVGESKMKRLIKGWGWKRSDFIKEEDLRALFKKNICPK